jgi:uncharacterized RDD family membrane protein YckC
MSYSTIGRKYMGARAFALFIDLLLMMIASLFVVAIFTAAGITGLTTAQRETSFYFPGDYLLVYILAGSVVGSLPVSILVGIGFLLFIAFLESRYGATLGKMIFALRVRNLHGQNIKFGQSLLRNMLKKIAMLIAIVIVYLVSLFAIGGFYPFISSSNLPFLLVIGLIALIPGLVVTIFLSVLKYTVNKQGQTLYDRWAGATVIGKNEIPGDEELGIFDALGSLKQLSQLRARGAITYAEFEEQKQKLLHKM